MRALSFTLVLLLLLATNALAAGTVGIRFFLPEKPFNG